MYAFPFPCKTTRCCGSSEAQAKHALDRSCLPVRKQIGIHGDSKITFSCITESRLDAASLGENLKQLRPGPGTLNKAETEEYTTCVQTLRACIQSRSLEEGKRIHQRLIDSGFRLNVYLGNLLINLYTKCGSIEDARQVFGEMHERDAVSWSIMISTLLKNGYTEEGVRHFCWMRELGLVPNSSIVINLLQEFADLGGSKAGKQIHAFILKSGFMADQSVRNALISVYARLGRVEEASTLFRSFHKNVVSWNAMITAYSQNGYWYKALKLFIEMQLLGFTGDRYTYASMINLCANLEDSHLGEQLHAQLIKIGLCSNLAVSNALITMYAKRQNMRNAGQVFESMPIRDAVSWNAVISGYAHNGLPVQALKLLRQMQWTAFKLGVVPNQSTFASALRICSNLSIMNCGKEVHARLVKAGLSKDTILGSALVDMYAKCGSIQHACRTFKGISSPNVISWNAMISGYTQNGLCEEALSYFLKMTHQGLKPTQFTFASVLKACAALSVLEHGRPIHGHIVKTGNISNVIVGTALVDMYAKCMNIGDAVKVFKRMHVRNLVSWNTLIAGYIHGGLSEEAFKLFCQMRVACTSADQYNLASILVACADLGFVDHGQQVHAVIIKTGHGSDGWVASTLVDMYAKCGALEDSCKVFDHTQQRDVVLWTVMISAFADHGQGEKALQHFENMLFEGLEPDYITFTGVLSACSQVGLVKKGFQYFDSMTAQYNIIPGVEHYACMVDLLGRSGYLEEAESFIKDCPFSCEQILWKALLTACRFHDDVERANRVMEFILEIGVDDFFTFSILSDIYVNAGRIEDTVKLLELVKENGVKREQGQSCINIKNRVQTFVAANDSWLQMD